MKVNRLKFLLVVILIPFLGFSQANTNTTLTICWDTSLSMKDRQLEKELSYLDSLFISQKIEKVQLITFANEVQEQNFTINALDWSSLKHELSKNEFDGAANYKKLNLVNKKGKTLVFTDGNQVFGNQMISLNEEDIIINSSFNADYKTLKLWEFINRVSVVDFTGSNKLKNNLVENPILEGFVYMDGKPIKNVLLNSSSGETFVTDEEGRFRYKATIGDTILINSATSNKQEKIVNDLETEIKFFLNSNVVSLDEVTVSEERLKELELVNVGYNSIEKKKIGFSVYEISEDQISEVETTVTDVLQEVPGLNIGLNNPWRPRQSGLSSAIIRGKSSISFDNKALVVVDGTPIQKSRNVTGMDNASYFHINPQNIKSIKVLKGLAATNLYGTEGSGGVILITTKTASGSGIVNGKPVDQARLKNNIFEGKLAAKSGKLNTVYLKELAKQKDLRDAYKTYLEQREGYWDYFWYFIDVSDYFRTANTTIANQVLSNILEISFDYNAYRTLFLKYVEMGDLEMADVVAQWMVKTYPNQIQSYFDLALAHKQSGEYQKAAELLNNMLSENFVPKLDFSPLTKVASTELRNLVNQHKMDLNLSKIDDNYKNNINYNARLRFDWASPKNEFVLKFVNPQKRFFDWEHSSEADKKRIVDEIQKGYFTEQFELVGEMAKGDWGIYVKNLSDNSLKDPFWLKCTIDYNFGKPNQSTEEKLIRLAPTDSKEQLFFEFVIK